MEASSSSLSDQEVDDRIPELLVQFRQAAESQGMHDQIVDLSETFIRQAYRRGSGFDRRSEQQMQEEVHDESGTETPDFSASSAPRVKSLPDAVADSHRSLDLIGDTDWTPQDGVHRQLVDTSKHALDLMLEAYAYLCDSSRDPEEAIRLARESLKRVRDGS